MAFNHEAEKRQVPIAVRPSEVNRVLR